MLKTDNAGEYFETFLGDYLRNPGIIHQSSCNDTPQENGIAERKNRLILEVACSLLFTMHVLKYFLGEAVLTACHLINRMPSRVLQFKSPYDTLLHNLPTTSVLTTLPFKLFGCLVFLKIHAQHRSKLHPKAFKHLFVGYSSNQKWYKCYSPISRRFYNSMDVTFFEHQPYYCKTNIKGESITQY